MSSLENPWIEQQTVILNRVIDSTSKLNESMLELNRSLQQINFYNARTAEVIELWSNYSSNVRFNLESEGWMRPPGEE